MATNKKEAFRQYLEAAGVLDTVTKSMVVSLVRCDVHLYVLATQPFVPSQFWSACTKNLSDRRMLLSKQLIIFTLIQAISQNQSVLC